MDVAGYVASALPTITPAMPVPVSVSLNAMARRVATTAAVVAVVVAMMMKHVSTANAFARLSAPARTAEMTAVVGVVVSVERGKRALPGIARATTWNATTGMTSPGTVVRLGR